MGSEIKKEMLTSRMGKNGSHLEWEIKKKEVLTSRMGKKLFTFRIGNEKKEMFTSRMRSKKKRSKKYRGQS